MEFSNIHIFYAMAWLSFGFGHSLLASSKAKNVLTPKFGPYYRLIYNAVASIHIFAIWLAGHGWYGGGSSFTLPSSLSIVLSGVSIFGLIIMGMSLKGYDLSRLTGTAQIRNHRLGVHEPEDEPLHTGGLHAYVRHPIYCGAYLILWGNAQDDFGLATAIWGSAYLAIGTFFEERFLVKLYGEDYLRYQARVPSVIPWRGNALLKPE